MIGLMHNPVWAESARSNNVHYTVVNRHFQGINVHPVTGFDYSWGPPMPKYNMHVDYAYEELPENLR